jgi:hypothetical protein
VAHVQDPETPEDAKARSAGPRGPDHGLRCHPGSHHPALVQAVYAVRDLPCAQSPGCRPGEVERLAPGRASGPKNPSPEVREHEIGGAYKEGEEHLIPDDDDMAVIELSDPYILEQERQPS